MKKTMMLLLMLVPFTNTLQAKKDPILDAIADSNLPELRHLLRVSDFDEGHREFYGNFAKEIVKDCKESMSSIFKSRRDLFRTAVGSILSVVGFGVVALCGYELFTENQSDGDIVIAGLLSAVGTGVGIGARYWAKRGLACPHAQSKLLKAQRILDHIKNFDKSETSSEEAKPA